MSVLISLEKNPKIFIYLISHFWGITTVMPLCQPLLRVSLNYTNSINAVNIM